MRVRASVRKRVTSLSVGRHGLPRLRHPSRVTESVFVSDEWRSNMRMVCSHLIHRRVLVPMGGFVRNRLRTSFATFCGLASEAVLCWSMSPVYTIISYAPQNAALCPPMDSRQFTSSSLPGSTGQPSRAHRSNSCAHGACLKRSPLLAASRGVACLDSDSM